MPQSASIKTAVKPETKGQETSLLEGGGKQGLLFLNNKRGRQFGVRLKKLEGPVLYEPGSRKAKLVGRPGPFVLFKSSLIHSVIVWFTDWGRWE